MNDSNVSSRNLIAWRLDREVYYMKRIIIFHMTWLFEKIQEIQIMGSIGQTLNMDMDFLKKLKTKDWVLKMVVSFLRHLFQYGQMNKDNLYVLTLIYSNERLVRMLLMVRVFYIMTLQTLIKKVGSHIKLNLISKLMLMKFMMKHMKSKIKGLVCHMILLSWDKKFREDFHQQKNFAIMSIDFLYQLILHNNTYQNSIV